MFNLSNWLVEGLKAGYTDKTFPFARITELTAGYLTRGLITDAQAENIADSCPMPTALENSATENSLPAAETGGDETA